MFIIQHLQFIKRAVLPIVLIVILSVPAVTSISSSEAAHVSVPTISPLSISAQSYTGIDIIFLVDQSGSMGGAAFGRPDNQPSDPTGLRFQTMQFAMQWLGDFRHYALGQGTVRMAVIAFGDPQREAILDWTELAPNGSDWDTQKANLEELLSADYFGARNFGLTNFKDAFALAQDLFDQLPPLAQNQRNLRIVVTITDGEPCLTSDPSSCTSAAAGHQQLAQLYDLVQRAFPEPDYQIYLLVIENQALRPPFWHEYESDWKQIIKEPHTPSHIAVMSDSSQMTRNILTIMDEVRSIVSNAFDTIPLPLVNGQATTFVPPYLRLIRFNVFKPNAQPGDPNILTLTRPDGTVLNAADPGITVSTGTANIEVWSVPMPVYGEWKVSVSDQANVEVYLDRAFMQSKLAHATQAPHYYQWQRVPIAPFLFFENESGGRDPITPLPEFPLDITAYLVLPSGTPETVSHLPLNPGTISALTPDRAQYLGEFTPLTPGQYTISLVGQVNDPRLVTAGQIYTPLDTRTTNAQETIEVSPVNVVFQPESLIVQRGGQWWATEPIGLCVILKDTITGTRIPDMDQVQVKVSLVESGNVQQESELHYQQDPSDSCTYRGTIAPPQAGKYELWIKGYLPDPANAGKTLEVFQRTGPDMLVEAQAVRYVRLQVREPLAEQTVNQDRDVTPFWTKKPLIVNVATVDDQGLPIDLNTLLNNITDPNQIPITLTISDSDGRDVTGKHQLHRLTSGSYELRTTDLPTGEYHIELSGPALDLRNCGCAYAPAGWQGIAEAGNRVVRIINRRVPLMFYGEIIAAVGVVLLMIAGFWTMYRKMILVRQNPVSGWVLVTKEAVDSETDVYTTSEAGLVDLGSFSRNTFNLSPERLGLSSSSPIKRIEITNHGKLEWKQKGLIAIHFKMKRGKKAITTMTMQPNTGDHRLYEDAQDAATYYIALENDVIEND